MGGTLIDNLTEPYRNLSSPPLRWSLEALLALGQGFVHREYLSMYGFLYIENRYLQKEPQVLAV